MRTVFLFFLLSNYCFAQNLSVPMKEGKIFYEAINTVEQKKDQTFAALRSWMANAFVSAKDVIQMDDKDMGQIVGKGIFYIHSKGLATAAWPCYFTISITVKDDKYRVQLNNFMYGEGKNTMESVYEMYQKGKMKNSTGNMIRELDEQSKKILEDIKVKAVAKIDDF